ncbi:HAMP domain-containing sensor histidine kinase [Paenibacillus sacheonensis]|uniref:Signal transduction histidine-protein kinase ArlS n=1 Tax=Paenibacillus sacheonensis TaxID=742054 RepID=A0A7X5C063_9BACL|nr:HAMP domain-containing histidine kinase [Paenibacillus sacheonensis]MBM7563356.1 signal transduction histidine kinase [Paenibacillus sacheonensis]NBC68089.1 HAMP domain-containing protein [Paenibacillus sacheonensis]
MTLRRRFTFFTIFWLIFILILFNIFVYLFVIKITIRSEDQLLTNKVNILLEDPRINDPHQLANPDLLRDYYNVNELMRVIDSSGKAVNTQGSDPELLALKPDFSKRHDTGMFFIEGRRVLYMKVPLFHNNEIIGTLEMYRKLTLLDSYLKVLVIALTITSIGAILFAIFGTYWFTSRLTSPIQHMVQTMREIDRSGKLRKIELAQRDQSAELLQLARAFNQMIERLDRTFERQKQFVADASHELKTPLTVISSYAGMLKRWGRDDANIRDEAIEAISKESQRLQNLTKSMLQLAQAETEDWLKLETFNLVQLADETADMLHMTFQRMIRVHTTNKQDIRLSADKEKIRQLLVILIDNAIKYSKEPIDISLSMHKNVVRFSVADKGIGIPEDEMPYLFERFYRVDGARSRTTGGVGLGLSIAKRIVDLHEGQIDVFSKPEQGTTISIAIPQKK